MHEKTEKKVMKLKLNKKTLESLDDNLLAKVSGTNEASYGGSGCISINTACCTSSYGGSGCISISTGCC
jgi:hypothetical protein